MADQASEQANRAGMTPGRLVVLFYLLSSLALAAFLMFPGSPGGVLPNFWAWLGWGNPALFMDFTLTEILGVALAAGIGLFCFLNPKIRTLSNEVAGELMKVTWPTWEETRASTTAVVVASLVAAVVLFGIDTVAYKLMVDWLPTLWGKL